MIVLKKLILVGWVHKPQPPNGGFELRLNVEDDGTAKAVAGTARGAIDKFGKSCASKVLLHQPKIHDKGLE